MQSATMAALCRVQTATMNAGSFERNGMDGPIGCLHSNRRGLGTRRLAILDTSDLGSQPMVDEATGNVLVYNGEIYNFRSLRSELEAAGFVFRSRSDTEVLLKAYARWGTDA